MMTPFSPHKKTTSRKEGKKNQGKLGPCRPGGAAALALGRREAEAMTNGGNRGG